TSVTLSARRNLLLRPRITASVTTATDTSPRARAGALLTSQGPSPADARGRAVPSSTRTIRDGSGFRPAIFGAREALVGLDDLLHELVTNDVTLVKIDERNSFDVRHHF